MWSRPPFQCSQWVIYGGQSVLGEWESQSAKICIQHCIGWSWERWMCKARGGQRFAHGLHLVNEPVNFMSRQKAVTQLLRATWDKIRRGPLAASCVMDHYLLPPLILISTSCTHTPAPKCTICTKISPTYLYSPGLTCTQSHKLPPGD